MESFSSRTFVAAGVVFFSFLVALVLPNTAPAEEPILVFAAASLADVLTEAGEVFEATDPARVTMHFAASSLLARQIRMGAPADVFLSADEAKMDELEEAGLLVDGTRRSLVGNQLVVVVPSGSNLDLPELSALANPVVTRIVLADSRSVPAGIYARQVLEGRGLWKDLLPRLIPVANARAALAAVESGNVDAGFVYLTDALESERVSIRYEVPVDLGPVISYPVAVVRRVQPNPAAVRFAAFLAEPEAGRIFMSHGFRLPDRSVATSVGSVETIP